MTPVSSAASGGVSIPSGGSVSSSRRSRRRVAFEIVLPGNRHQHLVRALVVLFFGHAAAASPRRSRLPRRRRQRIGAGALRLEEGEVLGAGRQRHDAHAGRQHRVRQHLQRVRNGGLLHLVGDVEILELGVSFRRRAKADDQGIAGQIDDGVGDEGRVLRLRRLGIGRVAGDLGFVRPHVSRTRNTMPPRPPARGKQLLRRISFGEAAAAASRARRSASAEAGINLVHCPKYPPPPPPRRRCLQSVIASLVCVLLSRPGRARSRRSLRDTSPGRRLFQEQRPSRHLLRVDFHEVDRLVAALPARSRCRSIVKRLAPTHMFSPATCAVHDRLAEHVGRIDVDVAADELVLDDVDAAVGADGPPSLRAEDAVGFGGDREVERVERLVADRELRACRGGAGEQEEQQPGNIGRACARRQRQNSRRGPASGFRRRVSPWRSRHRSSGQSEIRKIEPNSAPRQSDRRGHVSFSQPDRARRFG